jgi:hypothetical protein
MKKNRFPLILNCLLLISLIVTSCSGIPDISELIAPTPTMTTEADASTAAQQADPAALVETDTPLNTVIGHQSPITFYFIQPMNKASVESALTRLPVSRSSERPRRMSWLRSTAPNATGTTAMNAATHSVRPRRSRRQVSAAIERTAAAVDGSSAGAAAAPDAAPGTAPDAAPVTAAGPGPVMAAPRRR